MPLIRLCISINFIRDSIKELFLSKSFAKVLELSFQVCCFLQELHTRKENYRTYSIHAALRRAAMQIAAPIDPGVKSHFGFEQSSRIQTNIQTDSNRESQSLPQPSNE